MKDNLDAKAAADHQAALDDAQAKVAALQKQVQADQALDQRNPVNADRLDADKRQLSQAVERYTGLSVSDPDNAGLTVLDDAVAQPVHSVIPGAGNTSIRLLLAWFLAFALGAATVILVDRIDPRIRTKEMAELSRKYQVPVTW